jgi:hypothetical protein
MEEYELGSWVLGKQAEEAIARLEKKHKRRQEGNKKLMTYLNAGQYVQLTDNTIASLQEQGFDLVVEKQVYQGNLPVEERIEYFKVKLDK